jgi:hypothetical protein
VAGRRRPRPGAGPRLFASRGHGAWLEQDGRAGRSWPVRSRGAPDSSWPRASATIPPPGQSSRRARSFMDGFADVRRLGSAALDLCLVADGTFDAYGERGLNEHDFAAGALIAEEAGCWVRRPRLDQPARRRALRRGTAVGLDVRGHTRDVGQVPALAYLAAGLLRRAPTTRTCGRSRTWPAGRRRPPSGWPNARAGSWVP